MSSLKKQQKKLLTKEIASKVMEYLMGLNEENQPVMQKVAKKFSGRIVEAYYDAIKLQHKSILRATTAEAEAAATVEFEETANLMAS